MTDFLAFVGGSLLAIVLVTAICVGILGACVWDAIKSGKWHE